MAGRLPVLMTLLGVLVPACWSDMEYLYTNSPGDRKHQAGIYGGAVNLDGSHVTASNMYYSGYNCAHMDEDDVSLEMDSLPIKSMAYDVISKEILFQIKAEEGLTILRAPTCTKLQTCVNITKPLLKPVFVSARLSEQLGPFAYYNRTVYVLHHKQESNKRKLDLLKLTGCTTVYPVTAHSPFFLDQCSKEVSHLLSEPHGRKPQLRPTGHLLPIPAKDGLYFLTQVQRLKYNENFRLTGYSMQLLVVDPTGKVFTLHDEQVRTTFLQISFENLGGISYREGILCWSAISKVLCAEWIPGENLNNLRTVLQDGMGHTVCKGLRGDPITSNVTTGVAIAKTSPKLQIFFGCFSMSAGYGGLGLITADMESDSTDDTSVRAVEMNNTAIYAGSMFLTPSCPATLSHGPPYYVDTATLPAAHTLVLTCLAIMAAMLCHLH